MNILKILDDSLAQIGTIENVIEPRINEIINAEYTFSFKTIYDASTADLMSKIIEVDDDYFRVARITKRLDRSMYVFCEHISYDLNAVADNEEE